MTLKYILRGKAEIIARNVLYSDFKYGGINPNILFESRFFMPSNFSKKSQTQLISNNAIPIKKEVFSVQLLFFLRLLLYNKKFSHLSRDG